MLEGGFDKAGEEGVWREGAGAEFGVELATDEEGMFVLGKLDHLDELAVRGDATEL